MDFVGKMVKEFVDEESNQNQGQGQRYNQNQGQGQYNQGQDQYQGQGNNQYQGQGGQQRMPSAGIPHGGDDDDMQNAAQEASRRAGDSGDSDLFSSVLSSITQNKHQIANQDLDEQSAVDNHKKFFGGEDDGSPASSGGVGAAAAMQALKMFNGGSGGGSSGGSQGQFLALAMSEASKLFDSAAANGQVASGASKESAIQTAGKMAMQMYMKSQAQQQGGLMGLAAKFM